jgi:hypothetical protein
MEKHRLDEQIRQTQEKIRAHVRLSRQKNFFAYVLSFMRKASAFRYWQKGLAYFRRFRLIAVSLRIAAAALAFLETGALVILTTAVFLIVLPFLGALMLGVLITALLESRRTDRHLSRVIEGSGVYVLFMSEEPSAFFAQNVASLAEKGIVLIVSPHLILSRGIGQGRFYCTARLECKNVYLIRRYYFFHVKKKLLPLRSTAMLY